MAKGSAVVVAVRIPRKFFDFMESDVSNSGEYTNRSDWLTDAVKHYVEYREKLQKNEN